ncbi:MAG TPA: hypothetical protein VF794_02310 [Archangium sp.]|jgi:hypothetical protein|uniref:hypothetical protein n=1 Tax=Archangium sp. TaxID=1872627 RepID=UPI002EDAD262
MHFLRLAVLLTATSLLPACFSPLDCTEEFRPSVQVKVVDSQGRPQPDARVTYVQDDHPEQQAQCQPAIGATGCEEWWAGLDEPGSFVIKATSADGTRTAERRVTVGGDLCHANTEQVRLTLPD